ncbi:hypothetical protein FNU76_17260 [Chitinimonas arctica]|uniref:Uncharacterized protein n=1 Tax=Chitinimonas arctica TaxID=2594795 RepID=A0A516SIH2_9NEIS|nr:hypothetical protein [Chitinimonas arctica]QDQ27950.1 hypothetical protein FNU76_17260 [Chitinimonas arctica]
MVAVAVDSDPLENEKFRKVNDKCGSYTNMLTGEKVKYLGFALAFDPAVIEFADDETVRQLWCAALLERLDNPSIRIPKAFDYERFASDMRIALEIYSKASFA